MASRRHVRRKQCTGKVRHISPEAAKLASVLTHRKFGGRFNSYPCKFCKGWHVGHTPGKVKQFVDSK